MSPKIVDKSEKKSAILSAAMKQFAQKGVAAATMNDIAEEAGIGKGTIYEYFSTKEALFLEGFNNFYAFLKEELTKIVNSDLNAMEKLEKLVKTSIAVLVENDPDFARVMMEFWAEGIRSREKNINMVQLNEVYSDFRKIIADILKQGIKSGEFPPLSPAPLASLIIGALDGLYLQWFLEPEAIDLHKTTETFLIMLKNGLLYQGRRIQNE